MRMLALAHDEILDRNLLHGMIQTCQAWTLVYLGPW